MSEVSKLSLKELGKRLKEYGLTSNEIKEKYPNKSKRSKAYAISLAGSRNEWQETPPEGWTGDAPAGE